jgi:hypothetical protein
MLNIQIRHIDGSLNEYSEKESILRDLKILQEQGYEGKELINQLISDDWAAPPTSLKLSGTDANGAGINIEIFYE